MGTPTNVVDPAVSSANDVTPQEPVVDPSVPVITEPPNVPSGTAEAPADTTPPETTPDAAVERLNQELATKNKMLSAIGLDPASDLGEQLESGIITPEMLQDHVRSKFGPAPTTAQPTAEVSTDPVVVAGNNLKVAQAKCEAEMASDGSVTYESYEKCNQARDAVTNAKLESLTREITASKRETQVNQSVEAVLSVARQDPVYEGMSTELKQSFEQTSIALTGMLADQKARQMGLDPQNLTTQQYQYFAGEASKMLNGLAGHLRSLGRTEAKAQFNPASSGPNVNLNQSIPVTPANSAGATVPANDPYANATLADHREKASQYEKEHRNL